MTPKTPRKNYKRSDPSQQLLDHCFADDNPDYFVSAIQDHEEYLVRMMLRDTDFNMSRASIRLGIHRNTLSSIMRRLNITITNDPIQQLPKVKS